MSGKLRPYGFLRVVVLVVWSIEGFMRVFLKPRGRYKCVGKNLERREK